MQKKILVVDDSDSIRKVVTFTLMQQGYAITEAVDGLDALEKIKQDNFQLVLTDLYMPNMNGLALIKEIRAMDTYKYVPILFLTTENQIDKKQEAKKAGATGWLIKPFDANLLLRAIKKVLR